MRRVLDDIASIASEWLKPQIQAEWGERYSRRLDTRCSRKSAAEQVALGKPVGRMDMPY
jgi:hypothetical protein